MVMMTFEVFSGRNVDCDWPGRVLLRAGDVHRESGARDRDAFPRAANDSPSADVAHS